MVSHWGGVCISKPRPAWVVPGPRQLLYTPRVVRPTTRGGDREPSGREAVACGGGHGQTGRPRFSRTAKLTSYPRWAPHRQSRAGRAVYIRVVARGTVTRQSVAPCPRIVPSGGPRERRVRDASTALVAGSVEIATRGTCGRRAAGQRRFREQSQCGRSRRFRCRALPDRRSTRTTSVLTTI